MVKEAERESEEARARAKGEAMADRVTGKAQSYVIQSLYYLEVERENENWK